MTSVLTEKPDAVCPGEKGPWITQIQPCDTFIGFYVARNPRLDPFRDPSKGKYMRLLLVDRGLLLHVDRLECRVVRSQLLQCRVTRVEGCRQWRCSVGHELPRSIGNLVSTTMMKIMHIHADRARALATFSKFFSSHVRSMIGSDVFVSPNADRCR